MQAAISYEHVLELLMAECSPAFLVVFALFVAVVVNTIYIYLDCKKQFRPKVVLLFLENGMLTLAILVCCAISVLVMDAVGYQFYPIYDTANSILMLLFFIAAFLCLVDFIIVMYYGIFRKKKRLTNKQQEGKQFVSPPVIPEFKWNI